MAATSAGRPEGSLGIDVGTTGGEWVFKQDGMLFGPVPAKVLLDKLYGGEVTGDTPIAPEGEGQAFKRLREVPFFVVHVAKAEAKLRVDGEKQRHEAGEQRKGRAKLVATVVLALAAAGGAAYGVYWMVASRAFDESAAELDDIAIESSPPLITLAENAPRPTDEEELLDYVDAEKAPAGGKPAAGTGKPSGKPGATGAPSGKPAVAGATTKKPFDEENITETRYDQGAINRVVEQSKAKLHVCLKQQVGREPGFRGEVPISFTVDNNGRVGKLWLDKPGYKSGPLFDCMKAKLAEWRFPSFEGERPSVSLSFRVGK